MQLINRSLELIARWSKHAERYWYALPGEAGLGCYGSGYNSWGVQTNQKYVAAMATLATHAGASEMVDQQWAMERALSALRFSLWSHHVGEGTCTDGTKWGRTWISALGVERMAHAVHLLWPHMSERDRAQWAAMLVDQADWLSHVYAEKPGIHGEVWASTGKNKPESNLWNGAACWRAIVAAPDHPNVELWREMAHRYLVTSVSVPADADSDQVIAGKAVRERFGGANFFPNYALDHHGYLNVGYMVICTSNAAMLHFDMRLQGADEPQTLHHHQADLWTLIRRLVFSDGRLARIGGDTRVRYTYCQEYLIPALLYAADHLGEEHAQTLLEGQVDLIAGEVEINDNGSFYQRRLAWLEEQNPYYYTRLESDRACVLAMLATYLPIAANVENSGAAEQATSAPAAFESSVAGSWVEPEHGAVMHRCPTRLASFAWRANGLSQGLCQPPDDGHLAEWEYNLAGRIRFAGDDGEINRGDSAHRRLETCSIDAFEGGFVTVGVVSEGMNVVLPEGWKGTELGRHWIAFAALPDGHTAVGLQRCVAGDVRAYVSEIKGMLLNLPNDLYNGFVRNIETSQGNGTLRSPAGRTHTVPLHSTWACIEGRVGVVGIYGSGGLIVHRSQEPRGGKFKSLHVDQICWHCETSTHACEPGSTLLDVGWAVASSVNAEQTAALATSVAQLELPGDLRGVRVTGMDGQQYVVIANLGDAAVELTREQTGCSADAVNVVSQAPLQDRLTFEPGGSVMATLSRKRRDRLTPR